MVHDSERSIAASLVDVLSLSRRLDLRDTQQIVLYLKRNLQRDDILVHRTIQAIAHCVHYYSLHSFVDHRINLTSIDKATGTCYTLSNSLYLGSFAGCISIVIT